VANIRVLYCGFKRIYLQYDLICICSKSSATSWYLSTSCSKTIRTDCPSSCTKI